MVSIDTLQNSLQRDGFAIVERVLSYAEVDALIAAVDRVQSDPAIRIRNSDRTPSETSLPWFRRSGNSRRIGQSGSSWTRFWAPRHLPCAASCSTRRRARTGKSPGTRTSPSRRAGGSICRGSGPWSVKSGVPHVQPSAAVLERMLTVRIHFDESGQSNGPLKVLPGSHAHGVLSTDQAKALRASREPVLCTVAKGGAVLMRPLILHASSPATAPDHRRVIHLEFAAEELPGGLIWHERWPEAAADSLVASQV